MNGYDIMEICMNMENTFETQQWLFNMKMSEGGSVADHLNDFNTVTS